MKAVLMAAVLLVGCDRPIPMPAQSQIILGVDTQPQGMPACVYPCSLLRVDWNEPQFPAQYYQALLATYPRVQFIAPYTPIGTTVNLSYLQSYSSNVGAAAGRYCASGPIWELQNEPDDSAPLGEMQLSISAYLMLAEATARAIRNACPTATILSGGASRLLGADGKWPSEIHPLSAYVDGYAAHPYNEPVTSLRRDIVSAFQTFGKPVFLSEGPDSPALEMEAQGFAVEYVVLAAP